jgi:hypothetical protein
LPAILPANVPKKYPAVVIFPVALTTPPVNKFPPVIFAVAVNATTLTTAAATVTGGTVDGTVIGGTTPAAGTFTTLNASSFTASSINNTPIGNATPSTGAFTTLSATTLTATASTATNFATGNAQITGGAITGTPVSGSTVGATVLTTANAQITGGSVTGLTTLGAATGTVTNLSSSNATITGGAITGTSISGAAGAFTTLDASGAVNFTSTTESTAVGNGAVVIAGGTSVAKNLNVGGNVTVAANATVSGTSTLVGAVTANNGATINSTQAAGSDFVAMGVNSNTLIWAHASTTYDQVLVGNSAIVGDLVPGAVMQFNTTDSILLPVGTSAQRPSSEGFSDVAGMIRFNSTMGAVEYYSGPSGWKQLTSQFTIIADEQFSGDGSTTIYTLTSPQTTSSCIVSINGVVQLPTVAYSIGGAGNDVLTFTEAPALGDVIDVRTLITTSQVTTLESATGFNSIKLTNSNVKITTGASSTNDTVEWNTAGAEVNLRANVSVATSGSPTTVDSFNSAVYSSAEYTVTATIQNTNIRQICKVTLATDGTATVVEQFGNACTAGNSLVAFSGGFSGSSAQLRATTSDNNTILRIAKLYQPL